MKLKQYAQIGEVVGAAAIVVSLMFVAFELADSTRATRSSTANDAVAMTVDWYSEMGTSQQSSE